MGRWGANGEQVPTTLFEAAAFHWSIRATCPDCKRTAVFHGAALWNHFNKKHWRSHLSDVPARLRCHGCNRRGVRIKIVKEPPTVVNLPLPNDQDWKRAVSRFRA